ncbi:unnamed protein product [Caenorhabditis sp. 36 PRJEB53466]|nr:unnamed protein product [Caenorhabditis sp. 36 PRJEB53466]
MTRKVKTQEEKEEERRTKIGELTEAIEKLKEDAKFGKVENKAKMEKVLRQELTMLQQIPVESLDSKLAACNFTFYKAVMEEIETAPAGTVKSVLKPFSRTTKSGRKTDIVVDIVKKSPETWIKVVNRSASRVLVEYRDGKKNGNLLMQMRQFSHVAKNFNNPLIQVIFKDGVMKEIAEKLDRHGIEVIGRRLPKEELAGKWDETVLNKLAEHSDWEEDESRPSSSETTPRYRKMSVPSINMDVNAVMVLVSNLCEPGGADPEIFDFGNTMISTHAAHEHKKPSKPELLEAVKDLRMIMSAAAFEQFEKIVGTVGGPTEKQRFAELRPKIHLIEDPEEPSPKVALLKGSKHLSDMANRVFTMGDYTKTVTVTANRDFLNLAQSRGVYFEYIEVQPRPLTEQKEEEARRLRASKREQ